MYELVLKGKKALSLHCSQSRKWHQGRPIYIYIFIHAHTHRVWGWDSKYLIDGKAQVQTSQFKEMVTKFESVELRWTSLEPVIQGEVSQRKTSIIY